ncbi:hypothetical protein NFI96_027993 [Prochilodus magdalenae]|nr:hypothetical protein NFI96_027993 [Prochilodus magdalenae]
MASSVERLGRQRPKRWLLTSEGQGVTTLHLHTSTAPLWRSSRAPSSLEFTWQRISPGPLNTSTITKKAQQRLYFLLRRLRKAHLPPPILTTFYRGTIESILSSCITAWFGNCTASDRKSLQRVVRTAEKIIGVSLPTIMVIYTTTSLHPQKQPALWMTTHTPHTHSSPSYHLGKRMASSFVPVDNTRNGFTIVTQAVPGGREQYGLRAEGRVSTQGPLKKFLKGEPQALGTVQIMIGIMTFLFTVIKMLSFPRDAGFICVIFLGSCLYITSGSFSVAAAKKANRCVVTSSLIINVISAVAAGSTIVLMSFELNFKLRYSYSCPSEEYHFGSSYPCDNYTSLWGQSVGIIGVLLVFALLEFIISICTSAFACKTTSCAGAAVNFYRFVFRMASSFVPVENTRNGFTIVTQVVPAGGEQYGIGTGGGGSTQGPLKKFLKGQPKALGTVQIMIGIMTFLFGIVKTVYLPFLGVISGVTYWGSFFVGSPFYITSGSLSVAAAKRANRCVVTSSLIMNVISAVAAGIALVLLSIDMAFLLSHLNYRGCPYGEYPYRSSYQCDNYTSPWGQSAGISGVLVVFALLEFIISICTSAFACRAACCGVAVATIHVNYPETHNLAEKV